MFTPAPLARRRLSDWRDLMAILVFPGGVQVAQRRGRHLGGKRDATAAEANAATAQVRGLLDRILDGEAAAMAVEMIAAGNSPAA